ncbi:MAG: hypothetical protein M3N50_03660 [Pseudomonadota bacterium]|nr:hypothetical protein [Pseudomonadota bacterium]
MGQTTDQIATDIHKTRAELRSNFAELESKLKSVIDWKQHFRNHPGTFIAAAFGAGALLGKSGRGGKRSKLPTPHSTDDSNNPAPAKDPF